MLVLQMTKKFYGKIFIDKEKLNKVGINYPIKIEYYKIYDNAQKNQLTQFGIEIVKTEYKEDNKIIEDKEIRRITNEEKTINIILNKLKINQVTPVIANYVIEDLTFGKENCAHT